MNHGIESVSICEHLSVHHYVLYTVLIIKYRKENVSTKNLVGNLSFHHIFPCTIIISSPKTLSIECSGRTVMVVLHLFIHIWVNLIATPLLHHQITINLRNLGEIEKTGCRTRKRNDYIRKCQKFLVPLDLSIVMNNVEFIYFLT